MCDEFTAPAEALGAARLSRRAFGLAGTAAALSACTGAVAGQTDAALAEASVTITTPDGSADALFVHPSSGRHPGIVMWPDIAGIRPANIAMARRLATEEGLLTESKPTTRFLATGAGSCWTAAKGDSMALAPCLKTRCAQLSARRRAGGRT